MELEIALAPGRQENLFQMLRARRLPKFFGQLFAEAQPAADFVQAFLKLRLERLPTHEAFIDKILSGIRQQAAIMDPEKFRAYAENGLNQVLQRLVVSNILITPFSSPKGNIKHALRIWQTLLGSGLGEEVYGEKTYERVAQNRFYAMQIFTVLLASQRETRTWELLLQGVREGNREAHATFRKLLVFLGLCGVTPKFVPLSRWRFNQKTLDLRELLLEALQIRVTGEQIQTSEIPVPEGQVFTCNYFYRRLDQEWEGQHSRLIKLLSWFGAYRERFQAAASRMWEEIRTNPRFGLRPGGQDVVSIRVKTLRDWGYQCVQFFPEPEFPNVTARVWIAQFGTDIRVAASHRLTSGLLTSVLIPGADQADSERLMVIVDELQQFIAIHSFWKIANGQAFRARPASSAGGEKRRQELERKFLVRPHFRWLLAGWQPSERALQRSVETWGYLPPSGKTFVKSDPEVSAAGNVGPTNPIMVYTDADLGYKE